MKSLAIENELGRKEGVAIQYTNLGILEKQRGNSATACGHWPKAVALYKEVGISDKIAMLQNLMKETGCENTPS